MSNPRPQEARRPWSWLIFDVRQKKMNRVRDLLSEIKERRRCENAVDSVRKRTRRNLAFAGVMFAVAALNLWTCWQFGITETIAGKRLITFDGLMRIFSILTFVWVGCLSLGGSATDRLLLMMAEDWLDSKKEPNKAPEPTPMSVTPPANVRRI